MATCFAHACVQAHDVWDLLPPMQACASMCVCTYHASPMCACRRLVTGCCGKRASRRLAELVECCDRPNPVLQVGGGLGW